jgi:putative ABC transport system permease protein
MILLDLRFAIRALRRAPAVSAAAVLTLAIGIGANATAFSAFNALLLRPLPIHDIDRVVSGLALREGFDPFGTSLLEYDAYRSRAQTVERMGISTPRDVTLTAGGDPQRVRAAEVSAGYLETLGVSPALGRSFSATDDRPAAPLVVVLSFATWQRDFAADPHVAGRGVRIDGRNATVIGVMPDGFDFPYGNAIWVPLQIDIDALPFDRRTPTTFAMIARLRAGATLESADAELKQIAADLAREYPSVRRGWTYRLLPVRQQILGDLDARTQTSLRALLAGVALLLVICCANVAGLMLVRRAGRNEEIAIHLALGASRWRIASQALAESVVLGVLGGTAGLLVAAWVSPAIAALSPVSSTAFGTMLRDFSVDGRVLAYGVAIAIAATTFCGVVPVPSIQRFYAPLGALKRQDTRGVSLGNRRWLAGVVVGEVALAVTLLGAGALLVRSFDRLRQIDLGFDSRNAVAIEIALPPDRYPSHAARVLAIDAILQRVRALPGLTAAGTTTNVPLERISFDSTYTAEGAPARGSSDVPITAHRLVSPDYLATLGVRLVRGRLLQPGDRAGGELVAVVTEEFARQAWPGIDPIGRRVRRGRPDQIDRPWMTVVGVVADVKEDRFNLRIDRPVWYLPYAQVENTLTVTLVARARVDPSAMAADIRRAILAVDPAQPASAVHGLDDTVAEVLVTERFAAALIGTLAALGLVIAAVGLYGVMAHAVQRRTREFGLRMALGSRPGAIVRLVLRSGVPMAGAGLALGLASAVGAGRALSSVLYGVHPSDPILFAAVGLIVTAVCATACVIPALRASGVDPLVALRTN